MRFDLLLTNNKSVLFLFAIFCVVFYVGRGSYANEGTQGRYGLADVDHGVFQTDFTKLGTSCGFHNGKFAFFELLTARIKVVYFSGRAKTNADDLNLFLGFTGDDGKGSRGGKELFVAQFGHGFVRGRLFFFDRSRRSGGCCVQHDFGAPLGKIFCFLGVVACGILLLGTLRGLFAILFVVVVVIAIVVFLRLVRIVF